MEDCELSEENLNRIICSVTNLQTLGPLLALKRQTSKKLPLNLEFIYKSDEPIELISKVLSQALEVVDDPSASIVHAFHYLLENYKDNICKSASLFVELCNYCKVHDLESVPCDAVNSEKMNFTILEISTTMIGSEEYKSTITRLLPCYFSFASERNKEILVEAFFRQAVSIGNLDVLCILREHLQSLFDNDNYWVFLSDCLIVKDRSYLRKQAMFLLSSSLHLSNQCGKYHQYIALNVDSERFESIWRDYEILVDISQEKQLHLIQPSLQFLQNIKPLHRLWRITLYKLLLEHSQISVVYHVIHYILSNEEFPDVIPIFPAILTAVNRNQYGIQSQHVAVDFTNFFIKLNVVQFAEVIECSLHLDWTPTAFWFFLHSAFDKSHKSILFSGMFQNLLLKVKYVQHSYLRNACLKLLLDHCDLNNTTNPMELLNVVKILHEINREICRKFVEKNGLPELQLFESGGDRDVVAYYNLEEPDLYINDRLMSVSAEDDIDFFISLCSKATSKQTICEAFNILLNNTNKYNKNQKIASMTIVCNCNEDDPNVSKAIEELSKMQNQFSRFVVYHRCLLKFVFKTRNVTLHSDVIEVALTSQSELADLCFENFDKIVQTGDRKLITRTVETFGNCYKSCSCDLNKVLGDFFTSSHIQNKEMHPMLLQLFQVLVQENIPDVLDCLSGILPVFLQCSFDCVYPFLVHLIELIFYGTLVQKSQRLEYWICQQIRIDDSSLNYSPNLKVSTIRINVLNLLRDLSDKDQQYADTIAGVLKQKYLENFGKRYFPNSLIHFEKLRIIQSLLLIHSRINLERSALINLLCESFLIESHQPSVLLLMQWLMIFLLEKDENSVDFIRSKIEIADKSRPSSVSTFVPVLYHLVVKKSGEFWEQVFEILLPNCMGPQFKLRIISQIALLKLYEKGAELKVAYIVDRYKYLYDSLKSVVEATDTKLVVNEFLEVFPKGVTKIALLYDIPKLTGVCTTEWENIPFSLGIDKPPGEIMSNAFREGDAVKVVAIQKKITPWKDLLQNRQSTKSDLILVATLIEKSANLGGLSRTCEVFSVDALALKASKIADKDFQSLSMSSEKWLNIVDVTKESLWDFLSKMKDDGHALVGVEQTSDSRQVTRFRFPKKTVLVLGNEKEGIPPDLIPILDCCIEIPQCGQIRSLNVHVAGAIAMWEYSRQHLLPENECLQE